MSDFCAVVEETGARLDKFISEGLPAHSRTKIQQWIADGRVTVNGMPAASVRTVLKIGDRIDLSIPADPQITVTIRQIKKPVEIHFEDNDLLVVFKPAGLVTHPSTNHFEDSLVHRLFDKLDRVDAEEAAFRPGIVHRLDKDTSGLLVIAKTNAAKLALGRQFSEHSVLRRYLAVVWGNVAQNRGRITKKIGIHPGNRLKKAISEKGRDAFTNWQKITRGSGMSLLECRLETGRTHQIRVHLSAEGHPVVGDRLYGPLHPPKQITAGQRQALKSYTGQFLHAFELGFLHPDGNTRLHFFRRPPTEFLDLVRTFDPEVMFSDLKHKTLN